MCNQHENFDFRLDVPPVLQTLKTPYLPIGSLTGAVRHVGIFVRFAPKIPGMAVFSFLKGPRTLNTQKSLSTGGSLTGPVHLEAIFVRPSAFETISEGLFSFLTCPQHVRNEKTPLVVGDRVFRLK
jgi:hypothetical protein